MDSGKVMGCNDTSFQCDGSTSTFRVMFKEPVEINPNTNYIACATLKVNYHNDIRYAHKNPCSIFVKAHLIN